MKDTQIILLAGRKGGITKSTLVANLSAGLARKGYSVVAVESDGQGSLARMMNVPSEDCFYNLIANQMDWNEVLRPVPAMFAGESVDLALLPSSDAQMELEKQEWVGNEIYQRFAELRGHVDFVLIDTSPAINEVNSAFFYVADWILLPTLCERPSIDMLTLKTMDYIANAQEQGKSAGFPAAKILGIIPNRFDARKDTARVNIGFIEGRYGERFPVMPVLRDLAAWNRAAQYKRSIYTFGDAEDATDYERRQSGHASAELEAILRSILLNLKTKVAVA